MAASPAFLSESPLVNAVQSTAAPVPNDVVDESSPGRSYHEFFASGPAANQFVHAYSEEREGQQTPITGIDPHYAGGGSSPPQYLVLQNRVVGKEYSAEASHSHQSHHHQHPKQPQVPQQQHPLGSATLQSVQPQQQHPQHPTLHQRTSPSILERRQTKNCSSPSHSHTNGAPQIEYGIFSTGHSPSNIVPYAPTGGHSPLAPALLRNAKTLRPAMQQGPYSEEDDLPSCAFAHHRIGGLPFIVHGKYSGFILFFNNRPVCVY